MSEEQLKAFLEKVKADASLQEKLKAAQSPEDVVGIAKDHGHEFTADRLTELSEEEIESVAGGANICTGCQIATTCIDDSQILKYTNSG
jgi:predicted ribosomally synthesized peptide with nif11-like leader